MKPAADGQERLVKLAVRAQYQLNLPGNICADAPPTSSFEELQQRAQDREAWRKYWDAIAPTNTRTHPQPLATNNPTTTTSQPHEQSTTTTSTTTKQKRSKPKPTPWTNEQRQAWARAYYAKHYPDMVRKYYAKNYTDKTSTTATIAEQSSHLDLWTEQAQIPSDLHSPTPIPSTDGELWAAPAVPPTPTPPNTPTTSGEQRTNITFDTTLSPINPHNSQPHTHIQLSPIANT